MLQFFDDPEILQRLIDSGLESSRSNTKEREQSGSRHDTDEVTRAGEETGTGADRAAQNQRRRDPGESSLLV